MSLRAALRHQARACTDLGSPFTGRLLGLLADRLQPGTPLTDRLFDWPGDLGPSGASVPLRLAGALHGLVLDGADPDLRALYPPNPAPDDAALWQAVEAALRSHAPRLEAWLDRPPQTNEVARSAVLIALGHWLGARHELPFVVSELGASAGLNLHWDRYGLEVAGSGLGPPRPAVILKPDWSGTVPRPAAIAISDRRGVDLTPLDPADPGDRLRLLAYIWPDQPDRTARTRAAMDLPPAPVDCADAAIWLANRLTHPVPGHLHLIYHTIAWQYFAPDTQAGARSAILAAGARATASSPLAWFGMEADDRGRGAALSLRLWPGGTTLELGRADFHGRWVDWQAPEAYS